MAADVSVADPRLLYLTTFSLRKMPPSFQLKLFFFLNTETLARYTENVWGCSTSCPTFLTWWIIFDIKKKPLWPVGDGPQFNHITDIDGFIWCSNWSINPDGHHDGHKQNVKIVSNLCCWIHIATQIKIKNTFFY